MGGGFGIGALEELDEEDEDIYAPGIVVDYCQLDEMKLFDKCYFILQSFLQQGNFSVLSIILISHSRAPFLCAF